MVKQVFIDKVKTKNLIPIDLVAQLIHIDYLKDLIKVVLWQLNEIMGVGKTKDICSID